MHSVTRPRTIAIGLVTTVAVALALAACSKDATAPAPVVVNPASCPKISLGPTPATVTVSQSAPGTLAIRGNGADTTRYTAEIAVSGTTAYTTTWGVRRVQGNKVNIWDVSGNAPVLVDSVIVANAVTTGDIAVS